MKMNGSTVNRIIRLIAAIGIGINYPFNFISGAWELVLDNLAGIFLATKFYELLPNESPFWGFQQNALLLSSRLDLKYRIEIIQ